MEGLYEALQTTLQQLIFPSTSNQAFQEQTLDSTIENVPKTLDNLGVIVENTPVLRNHALRILSQLLSICKHQRKTLSVVGSIRTLQGFAYSLQVIDYLFVSLSLFFIKTSIFIIIFIFSYFF
jgi:hypothetical protein